MRARKGQKLLLAVPGLSDNLVFLPGLATWGDRRIGLAVVQRRQHGYPRVRRVAAFGGIDLRLNGKLPARLRLQQFLNVARRVFGPSKFATTQAEQMDFVEALATNRLC